MDSKSNKANGAPHRQTQPDGKPTFAENSHASIRKGVSLGKSKPPFGGKTS